MYLNDLMTDDELINAAQYAESHHLRLLADRLDARRDDVKRVLDIVSKSKDLAEQLTHNESMDFLIAAESELREILAR
jgi:hypothetical protein